MEHLLPGLSPLGVPRKLISTSLPIRFTKYKDLLRVYSKKNYPKILIVEGARFDRMTKILQLVLIRLKNKKIVLIIDEITSGWRANIGGVYKDLKLMQISSCMENLLKWIPYINYCW